ncbi:MAG: hypothetical protein AABX38_04205 [Candidatus Micrarchaeota archaeon]
MPLKAIKPFFEKYKGWIENGFWVLVLIVGYIAMQKAMHPETTVFGF